MSPKEKISPESNIEFAVNGDVDGILAVQESVLLENKDPNQDLEKSGFIALRVSKEAVEQAVADNCKDTFLAVARNKESGVVGYFLVYDMDKWLALHPEWILETGLDPILLSSNKVIYGKQLASNGTIPGIGRELDKFLFNFAKEEGYNLFIIEICEKPFRNSKSIDLHTINLGFKRIGENKDSDYTFGIYAKNL